MGLNRYLVSSKPFGNDRKHVRTSVQNGIGYFT